MEHQVGMATVFLVVIAVGAWALPKLRHVPDAAGGAVVSPDAAGEAAPSAALQPAEPLDLKVDRRSGRIRSAEEVAEEAAARPASTPAAPVAPADDSEYALAERAQGSGAEPPAEAAAKSASNDEPKGEDVAADSVAALRARVVPAQTVPAKRSEPSAFPASSGSDAHARRDTDGLLADETGVAPARPASGGSKAKSAETEALREGAAAALAEPAGAAAAPAPTTASTNAASLLRAARSTRGTSGCVAALPRYRAVTTSYPGTPEAGEALLESARCLTELGRHEEARAALVQATRIASSAARARQRLAPASAR
jgi:hypothetical protein